MRTADCLPFGLLRAVKGTVLPPSDDWSDCLAIDAVVVCMSVRRSASALDAWLLLGLVDVSSSCLVG